MKVVALVPIKLNSERLANKNVLPFTNGKPLITYILDTLSKVSEIDKTYVYCSSDSAKEFLPRNISFLKRDSNLDLSTTPFNDVLSSFARLIPADYYVLSHSTAPFLKASSIQRAIQQVLSGSYDSALSIVKLNEFLWKNSCPFNYDPSNIPRTQDLDPLFAETCGLYIYKRELILNENRRVGHKPFLLEVSKIEALDINTKEDFIIADAVYNSIVRENIQY